MKYAIITMDLGQDHLTINVGGELINNNTSFKGQLSNAPFILNFIHEKPLSYNDIMNEPYMNESINNTLIGSELSIDASRNFRILAVNEFSEENVILEIEES